MSYIQAIFHAVKCDRCGETHEGEYEYFTDECDAFESAQEDDWIEIDGKHYCPCCYHEVDDENVPLKPFPQIYWAARAACKKLGTMPRIEFTDNGIKIISGKVSSQKLVEGVIDWLLRQHNNGNWGVYTATCEEPKSAYMVLYNLVVNIELKGE